MSADDAMRDDASVTPEQAAAWDRIGEEILRGMVARDRAERERARAAGAHRQVVQALIAELDDGGDVCALTWKLQAAMPEELQRLAAASTQASWGRVLRGIRARLEAEREPHESLAGCLERLAREASA